MMHLHGQADTLVPHGQSVLLHGALRIACTGARFFPVPGTGHGTSNVLGSSHHGARTVRTTSARAERTGVGSPDPGWDVVERFLRKTLDVGGTEPTGTPTLTPTGTRTGTPGRIPIPEQGRTAACTVSSPWDGGFVADVTVTAGSAPIDGGGPFSRCRREPGPPRRGAGPATRAPAR